MQVVPERAWKAAAPRSPFVRESPFPPEVGQPPERVRNAQTHEAASETVTGAGRQVVPRGAWRPRPRAPPSGAESPFPPGSGRRPEGFLIPQPAQAGPEPGTGTAGVGWPRPVLAPTELRRVRVNNTG